MGKALERARWFAVSKDEQEQICAMVGSDVERVERDARTLLEWVNMQPHLPTLDESELPFMRVCLLGKKNSMEKAKKSLDQYYTARSAYPELFGNLDYTEEELRKLSKFESLVSADDLTPDLTRIVFGRLELSTPEFDEVSVVTELKIALMKADIDAHMDWFSGIEIVLDIGNFNYHYAKRIVSEINTFGVYIKLVMSTIPLRVKHIHLVHPPAIFHKTFPLILTLFKEKMRNRIILHDSIESLHKYVPVKCLPKELGGELPSSKQIEADRIPFFLKPSTLEFCAYQRTLRSDESKRPGGPSKQIQDNYGMEGSFRKLALD